MLYRRCVNGGGCTCAHREPRIGRESVHKTLEAGGGGPQWSGRSARLCARALRSAKGCHSDISMPKLDLSFADFNLVWLLWVTATNEATRLHRPLARDSTHDYTQMLLRNSRLAVAKSGNQIYIRQIRGTASGARPHRRRGMSGPRPTRHGCKSACDGPGTSWPLPIGWQTQPPGPYHPRPGFSQPPSEEVSPRRTGHTLKTRSPRQRPATDRVPVFHHRFHGTHLDAAVHFAVPQRSAHLP